MHEMGERDMSTQEQDVEVEEDLGPFQAPTDKWSYVNLPELIDPDDKDWVESRACVDPHYINKAGERVPLDFFDGRRKAEAKAICATCPVTQECLEFALKHDEKYGVWGGLDADERKALHGT